MVVNFMAMRTRSKVALACMLMCIVLQLTIKFASMTSLRLDVKGGMTTTVSQPSRNNARSVPSSASASTDVSRIWSGSMDHFCVEWDQDFLDVDKWWTHHPLFAIERQNTTHQCFQKEANPVKRRFLGQLHINQFRNKCDAVLPRILKSAGWGADFNGLGEGLLIALLEKKPMIFVPNPYKPAKKVWQYAAKKDGTNATCPSKDIDCYFLPITKCDTSRSYPFEVDTRLHTRDEETWPWVYQYLT